jgi:hypothetical protein
MRFNRPNWLDDVPVAERSGRLRTYFQERMAELEPWMGDIRLLKVFDLLLSATVEGSEEACDRLRTHLREVGAGDMVSADATFHQVQPPAPRRARKATRKES